MARSFGIREVKAWTFQDADMPQEWIDHLGELPERFLMYIDGEAGAGKTEYEMQFSAMLAKHVGKVHVNNCEQGKHKGIMQSAKRNLIEVPAGKWMYGQIKEYEALKSKIKSRNSGKIWFIDSISYFNLTEEQIRQLFEEFPRKSFVLIAYAAHFTKNKAIRHLCDIKVRCADYIAKVQASRFGGGKDWVIWDRKEAKKDLYKGTLFEAKGGSNG